MYICTADTATLADGDYEILATNITFPSRTSPGTAVECTEALIILDDGIAELDEQLTISISALDMELSFSTNPLVLTIMPSAGGF